MRIELIKNEEDFAIGYKMILEEGEDPSIIEQIRNMYFLGYKGYGVHYDGRKVANDYEDTTTELSWIYTHFKREKIRKIVEEQDKFFSISFSDLEFKERGGGYIANYKFDNKYQISVCAGKYSRCHPKEFLSDPLDYSEYEVLIRGPRGRIVTDKLYPEGGGDICYNANKNDISYMMRLIIEQ